MDKNVKPEQIDQKNLKADVAIEEAFARIYCWRKELCADYGLCDRTGTCYLRQGDER